MGKNPLPQRDADSGIFPIPSYVPAKASFLFLLISNSIEHYIIWIVHYNDRHFEKLQTKGSYPQSLSPPL